MYAKGVLIYSYALNALEKQDKSMKSFSIFWETIFLKYASQIYRLQMWNFPSHQPF